MTSPGDLLKRLVKGVVGLQRAPEAERERCAGLRYCACTGDRPARQARDEPAGRVAASVPVVSEMSLVPPRAVSGLGRAYCVA